jgi:hypothetical protein
MRPKSPTHAVLEIAVLISTGNNIKDIEQCNGKKSERNKVTLNRFPVITSIQIVIIAFADKILIFEVFSVSLLYPLVSVLRL